MVNYASKIPVLIVDNRPENLTSLEAILEDMELDLVTARSGNDALRLSLHTDFALILMDVMMPEMDGYETAEFLRKNPKTRELPIIFITAGSNEKCQIFRGYEVGAVDYLTKPIEPAILRSKVRVFCDLFRQSRELKRIQVKLELQNAKLLESYRQLEEETAQRLRMTEELREQEQMLLQQSRLAAMGEMIGNIAHQWRQPINTLGLTVQQLLLFYDMGEFNRELLEKNVSISKDLIKHMSTTIDDFRNFFRSDKEKVEFKVTEAIASTMSIVDDSFKSQHIAVEVVAKAEPTVFGYHNEYGQVLLVILNNARDAFTERNTESPRVTITIGAKGNKAVVTVADNAGGIPEEVMDKIFDPYFTTKGPQQGTGVGLFMSKIIIEKNMGGRLSARNTADGAEFRVEV
ncbi:MAG: response regulator [Oryzomonas sp.]|uniref:response regulator n=1 Tax=Oryzomonas sp. TaxID=2855186 RepID=UPI0028490B78|nr:response regulator [Oryzomonas sp.]MDR3580478.1 response regulator [Oryzomonas sp.]